MRSGHLSQYFTGIAAKRLRDVEVNAKVSNQHEFNGVNGLRAILGDDDGSAITSPARFIYLTDDDPAPEIVEGKVSWYDSRRNQPHRAAEYRLYYPASAAMEKARPGDLLVVARRRAGDLLIIIADEGTTAENQIHLLFGLGGSGLKFEIKSESETDELELGFVGRFILELLGIEIEETDENYLEPMVERFGDLFPTTRIFSEYARNTLRGVNPQDDPDQTIIAWMEREELLFRTFERHIVADRLRAGFGPDGDDVDEFVSFSLSVQNRRKSRAGHALENHLETVFQTLDIRYSRTGVTENKSKPDFLFPGVKEYHDGEFPISLLTVLGVKASCKDRWRQVLSEAKKIDQKHLLTLEPGISAAQTTEMRDKLLQLVVPAAVHATYTADQRQWLLSLRDFVGLVKERQSTT
ncbi:MAG: type II restriction endonuclease [Planctomycetaceae bacterium]